MTIDEEIQLRASTALSIWNSKLSASRIDLNDTAFKYSIEHANKIVDNAIEKSYEVKK
jgi:hypothetical protein